MNVCIYWGFPCGASGKEPTCQCRRHRDVDSIPGLGRPPWRRKWQPTPVFLPGESFDGGSWQPRVSKATKSWDTTEVT